MATPEISPCCDFTRCLLELTKKLSQYMRKVYVNNHVMKNITDKRTQFPNMTEEFINHIQLSQDTNPAVVMCKINVFLMEIKRRLLKYGSCRFKNAAKKLDVETRNRILDKVLHKLVVCPLKHHLYHLYFEECSVSGELHLLSESIRFVQKKSMYDLGVCKNIAPLSKRCLMNVWSSLRKMQREDAPLEKLNHIVTCMRTITNSVKTRHNKRVMLDADNLLAICVWLLARNGMLMAGFEAEYMRGFMDHSLLIGEGGYCVTTLSSAVEILKNYKHNFHWSIDLMQMT